MNKTSVGALLSVLSVAGMPAMSATLYEAEAAVQKQDFARAFASYKELAEIGHPLAQESLAVLYVNGEGVARDNVLGYAWAKLALEQGEGEFAASIVRQLEPHLDESARARIAEIKASFGVEALQASLFPESAIFQPAKAPLDPATVCRMKAAPDPDQFYPREAKFAEISGEVMVEVRVEVDGSVRLPRALYSFPPEIFEEAGRHVAHHSQYTPKLVDGVPTACTMRFKVKFGIGDFNQRKPDRARLKIIEELRAKAAAGDPISQLYYGLASGLRPEYRQEDDGAKNWILKAAQAGIPAAQFLVGNWLFTADAEPEKRAKALRWLEMGAKNGSGAAMTALAGTLLRPERSPEDRRRGFEWMERAAATKHREGKFLFAVLLVSDADVARRDPDRALKLLDEVANAFDYDPLLFETRGAALAARGEFGDAVLQQAKALDKARKLKWDVTAQEERLRAYKDARSVERPLVNFW